MKVKVERNADQSRWAKMPTIQQQLDAIWELLPKTPGPADAEAVRAAVTALKDRFKKVNP